MKKQLNKYKENIWQTTYILSLTNYISNFHKKQHVQISLSHIGLKTMSLLFRNYNKKWISQPKTFHIRKPKNKSKFLVYLAALKLTRNFQNLWTTCYLYSFGYLYKSGRKGASSTEKWLVNRILHTAGIYNYLIYNWIRLKETSIIMFLVLSAVKELL